MKDSFTNYVVSLILAVFMTSISNMSTNSLVHDLQHDNDVKHTVSGIHHSLHQFESGTSNTADAEDVDPDCKRIDTSEHQILHALNHLQFFPNMLLAEVVRVALASTPPLQFDPQFLPLSNIDLPLRPPQNGFLRA